MRSPPDDDDFRRAIDGVQPLPEPRRRPLRAGVPAPVPRQTRLDERAALVESLSGTIAEDDALESGEELVYLREGVSSRVLRKLRRGHWVIQDALDLHGLNRIEAERAVSEFLARCVRRQLRCVRVIHGKGHGSHNREPVLKRRLFRWLVVRDEVLAFCQAPAAQGGGGAVLVLLKSGR